MIKTYLTPSDRFKEEAKSVDMKKIYTVKELRLMAKDRGLVGYSKMKEQDLITLLGL